MRYSRRQGFLLLALAVLCFFAGAPPWMFAVVGAAAVGFGILGLRQRNDAPPTSAEDTIVEPTTDPPPAIAEDTIVQPTTDGGRDEGTITGPTTDGEPDHDTAAESTDDHDRG